MTAMSEVRALPGGDTGVAIVGASENNIPWTAMLVNNLVRYGFRGEIWPVNPRRSTVVGRPCHPSIADLPGRPGIGVVLLSPARAVAACRELIAAGCTEIVVVSNGFRETGDPQGRAHEQALREACAGTGVRLFGPNCVGFASFHDDLCSIAQPIPVPVTPGSVSVVSQSGGLTAAVLGAVAGQGLGVDVCYSIGNGAVFGLTAALREALARPATRMVCAVVESVDEPDAIRELAARARAAGKHLAFLVLGQSEGSREVAQSHTGAVVGEYRMVAAWLRRTGIPVARTPDELAHLAAVLTRLGPPDRARGAFVATVSGGGAGMAGDLAARHEVPLARLSAETAARLRTLLPPGSAVGNPLDVSTGDAPAAYAAVAADPGVGVLVEPWMLSWPDETDRNAWWRAAFDRVTGAGRAAGKQVIIGSLFPQPLNDWARDYAARNGILISADLDRTLAALGALYAVDDPAEQGPASPPVPQSPPAPAGRGADGGGGGDGTAATDAAVVEPDATPEDSARGRLVTEAEGREILGRLGLPLVAGRECADVEDVVRAARELAGPLVLKLSAPGVGHRDRVGGIRLGLAGEDALRRAAEEIRASAEAAGVPAADIGFLVEEMVFGPEILIGAIRDPIAGPTVTVAVGGWAAEAGATFGTLVLPLTPEEITQALARRRLPHLLGDRRTADLAALLTTVATEFATGALAAYRTVELNPVILGPDGPRVVDVLMVT